MADRQQQAEDLSVSVIQTSDDFNSFLSTREEVVYYVAKYDVIVSNRSARATSVVSARMAFMRNGAYEDAHVAFDPVLNGPLEPLNLEAGEAGMFPIYFNKPISKTCVFEGMVIPGDIQLQSLINMFSVHDRMFPSCRSLTSKGLPAPEPVDAASDTVKVEVETSRDGVFSVVARPFLDVYNADPKIR